MTAATAAEQDNNVFTILRVPLASSWGKYSPSRRLMLLADDLSADHARQVVRDLLTGQVSQAAAVMLDAKERKV